MPNIKVYADIFANTAAVPTDEQWRDLAQEAKAQPLAAAIIAAARSSHNQVHMHKLSQGAGVVNRHALLVFEIDDADRAALVAVLNAQATARSVTGTQRQKFDGVLTGELQDAATALGYGGQAGNISVALVAIGADRAAVEAVARAYIVTNEAVWHE